MEEGLGRESCIPFKAYISSSTKKKREDKKINSHDDDFRCIEGESQCNRIKENGDNFTKEIEDLMLGIKNIDGTFSCCEVECDLSEEQENYLLGIKDISGNFVNNNETYDLTEEEENYLLSDCTEHFLRGLDVSNLNINDTVAEREKLYFIDVSPSPINNDNVYSNQYVIFNSKNESIDRQEDINLYNSADQEGNKIGDYLVDRAKQIHFNDFSSNPENKFNVSNYEVLETEKNSANENVTENDIVSDIISEELYLNNSNSLDVLRSKFFTKPTTISTNTSLLSKYNLINSSMEVDSDKESEGEDVVGNFDLFKVMSSDIGRKNHLCSFKDKNEFLFISFNNYNNGFSQNSSECLLNVQPIDIVCENADHENTIQFNNQFENSAESTIKGFAYLTQNTNIKDLSKLHEKEEIRHEVPEQFMSNVSDKLVKDGSKPSRNRNPANNTNRLSLYIAEENASYRIADTFNSKENNILEISKQQNINMDDLYKVQNCSTPNQILISKKVTCDPNRQRSSKIYQTLPGYKFTELLNNSLFVPYQDMDFQLTNDDSNTMQSSHCQNIVSRKSETIVPHSKYKHNRNRRNYQVPPSTLRHSDRIYALRRTNPYTKRREQHSKGNFCTQTIFDLFRLDNKLVTCILSALLSGTFQTGALLRDLMKYLRREMALKIPSKLRQDIAKFLNAAVDAGIVQMKYGRYFLKRVRGTYARKKADRKIFRKNKNQDSAYMTLRKYQKK